MIYADHAATAPLLPCAREVMEPYLGDEFANSAAPYRSALRVRQGVERARDTIAGLLGCEREEIYFTSGGCEGNSWAAWTGALAAGPGGCLLTTPVEHHSLIRSCEGMAALGVKTALLPVDGAGRVSAGDLPRALERRPALVSIQYANNELGTVQDVPALAAACRASGLLFHTDAVQAVGHIPVSLQNVDLLTASAHKFGGPKGVGFLYARRGTPLKPLISGGSQERGLRGGTANAAGVVGMAAALEWSVSHREENTRQLCALTADFRDALHAGFPDAVFHGEDAEHLPGLVSVALPGHSAEGLVYRLDTLGLCVSAGAACAGDGARSLSHVLAAVGIPPELAACTLRFSFGPSNPPEDGKQAAQLLLRALSET